MTRKATTTSQVADAGLLMNEVDIRITTDKVITPAGEFPIDDIRVVESRITKPLWGPVLLVLLGTLNLAAGLETRFWLDLVVAGLMIGGGVFWRSRGTHYQLMLRTSAGEIEAWSAPDEARLQQAVTILNANRE